MIALAMILGYVESLIPPFWGMPGMKLGLPNLVFLMMLQGKDFKGGIFINICRVILLGFLFGNGYSLLYSLAGAVCSMFIMLLLYQSNLFSLIGISAMGGIFHNLGQLFVAILVVKTFSLSYYFPMLLVSGCLTGIVLGIVAIEIQKRIYRI